MKEFLLLANCTFMAESIDDAMVKIASHLARMSRGVDYDGILTSGCIEIKPVNDDDKSWAHVSRVLSDEETYGLAQPPKEG